MPRSLRYAPGGMIFHVLNRANGRSTLFSKPDDYRAFLGIVSESLLVAPIRILAYCVMSSHWHFVLWPEEDGQLSAFMHQMTNTHVKRWHEHHHSVGLGHVYQGPYKSFPVQDDEHFYTLCRYVERNAARANLVALAEDWRWSSLWLRQHPSCPDAPALAPWPLPMPSNWMDWVNQPLTEAELAALRTCIRRGRPFGSAPWQLHCMPLIRISERRPSRDAFEPCAAGRRFRHRNRSELSRSLQCRRAPPRHSRSHRRALETCRAA